MQLQLKLISFCLKSITKQKIEKKLTNIQADGNKDK